MTKNSVLNYENHKNLHIAQGPHLDKILRANNVDVAVHEFEAAACTAPVIFIKDQDSGEFRSVIVTGLKMNENLLFENNKWQPAYVPHVVGNSPFSLGRVKESYDIEDLEILIDEESSAITDRGIALFNEDKSFSDYVVKTKESLKSFVKYQQVTLSFLKYLSDKELLVKRTFDLTVLGEVVSLHGIYIVDQNKIEALDDKQFLELRGLGY